MSLQQTSSVESQLRVATAVEEELAAGEAFWRLRALSAEEDRDTYRDMTHLLLRAVDDVTKQRDSKQRQLEALREELRRYLAMQVGSISTLPDRVTGKDRKHYSSQVVPRNPLATEGTLCH